MKMDNKMIEKALQPQNVFLIIGDSVEIKVLCIISCCESHLLQLAQ